MLREKPPRDTRHGDNTPETKFRTFRPLLCKIVLKFDGCITDVVNVVINAQNDWFDVERPSSYNTSQLIDLFSSHYHQSGRRMAKTFRFCCCSFLTATLSPRRPSGSQQLQKV